MTRPIGIALGALLLVAGCAAETRHAPGEPPFAPAPDGLPARPALPGRVQAALFAPDRVLAEADAIALGPEARRAIADDVRRTQAAWDGLAERLRVEERALAAVLDRPTVDPDAAARAAAAVLETEGALKAEHLALLVRVKNRLTVAQQEQLARRAPGSGSDSAAP